MPRPIWVMPPGSSIEAETSRPRQRPRPPLRIDPASQEAKSLIGVIAWQLKEYQVAERTLQELHVENPGNFSVERPLGPLLG